MFPLYWHSGEPFSGASGHNALFPLWIYHTRRQHNDLHLLWPLLRFHNSAYEAGWRIWPLAGHRAKKNRTESHSFWLWPLGGQTTSPHYDAHWFFPFYGYEESVQSFSFVSLPWMDMGSDRDRTRIIPLTLSWHRQTTGGETALTLLAGVLHIARDAAGKRRGHLFPLCAFSPSYTISPVYARHTSDTSTVRAAPLLLTWHTRDHATGVGSLYAAAGLFHTRRGVEGSDRNWLLPLYYRNQAEGTVVSPLYAQMRANGVTHKLVPPLLSWRNDVEADGAYGVYAAAGLYHRRRGTSGRDRDWLLPFYYHDRGDQALITPLFARQLQQDGAVDWSAIPPLLSWRTHDPSDGTSSLYAGGGLYHRRRGAEGRDRDWLLPLYYRDQAEQTFVSSVYSRIPVAGGTLSAVPVLLSWKTHNRERGVSRLYAGGGMYHRGRDVEGNNRDWLLPLFYRVQQERLFLSPLYAARGADEGSWAEWKTVPPLLTLYRKDDAGAYDTFAAGGLLRVGKDAEGRRRSWLLPLYAARHDRFLSLLYARWNEEACQSVTQAIPPLLSWQQRHTETGRGDRFGLLGLYHTRLGVRPEEKAGHLLPLYLYDRTDSTLLTPLAGRWNDFGTRYTYYATPLMGTSRGARDGFWLFPLVSHRNDAKARVTRLLWARHENRTSGSATTSVFPFYKRNFYGDPAPLLAAMDSGMAPVERPKGRRGSDTRWLLFIGGRQHRVEASVQGANQTRYILKRRARLFPFWSSRIDREVVFTGTENSVEKQKTVRRILYFLYDHTREKDPERCHDYVRQRVLWRLWHYERLNADTTMDAFPAITWDKRADGMRTFSFMWRLFRNQVDADGHRSLDLLFIPVKRPPRT